jgi:hypothetical protein
MCYELIWEPRGVVKRYFNQVTDEDLLKSVVEVGADARFDDLRYVINDFSACDAITATFDGIENIAVIDRGAAFSNPRIRIAVVAIQKEAIALAEAYANFPLKAYPMRIFATLPAAREWIGDA